MTTRITVWFNDGKGSSGTVPSSAKAAGEAIMEVFRRESTAIRFTWDDGQLLVVPVASIRNITLKELL